MMHEHATSNQARAAGLQEAREYSRKTGLKSFYGGRDGDGRVVFSPLRLTTERHEARHAPATAVRRARLRVIEAELTLNRSRRLEQLHRELGGRP